LYRNNISITNSNSGGIFLTQVKAIQLNHAMSIYLIEMMRNIIEHDNNFKEDLDVFKCDLNSSNKTNMFVTNKNNKKEEAL